MKRMNWVELLECACKQENMWGVSIKFEQFEEKYELFVNKVIEAFPTEMTKPTILGSVICDEFLLFDTEEEARKLYNIMEQEPFTDNVYACLVSPTEFCTENT